MVRPKKPRFVNGVQLEENLYPDNKGRDSHYRYLRPDGTYKHFQADTVHKANELAAKANRNRDNWAPKPKVPGQTILLTYVQDYIEFRERESPEVKTKQSWINRKSSLKQFAKSITHPPSKLSREHIQSWWNTLNYHQRKQRHAAFRRFFNYMMGRGVLPKFEYNPFTTADDRPRLYLGDKPSRIRHRLDLDGFWKIYDSAGRLGYRGVQIAMGLSLVTFMRQSDILSLKLDQLKDGNLQVVISKSEAQKGYSKASRLQWGESHSLVKQLIQTGRELSLENGRCPYLISHRPARKVRSKEKSHFAQLTKRRFIEQFSKARDATGDWNHLKTGERPTFHEIRSLADALATKAGYDLKLIQHAMAHSDEAQTLMYQANHELPYEDVDIVFDEKMVGRCF